MGLEKFGFVKPSATPPKPVPKKTTTKRTVKKKEKEDNTVSVAEKTSQFTKYELICNKKSCGYRRTLKKKGGLVDGDMICGKCKGKMHLKGNRKKLDDEDED